MLRRAAAGRAFFITDDFVAEQLKQVVREFPPDEKMLLTRCLRCNARLEEIPRESVEDKIPPYVFKTQTEFSSCPACHRVYWKATHRQRMMEDLKKLLG